MSFADLEMKVIQWAEARKIIPNATPQAQLKKLDEEVAEFREELVAGDREKMRLELGDILIVLINVAALVDLDLVDCGKASYQKIKDRKGYLSPEGFFIKEVARP